MNCDEIKESVIIKYIHGGKDDLIMWRLHNGILLPEDFWRCRKSKLYELMSFYVNVKEINKGYLVKYYPSLFDIPK